MRNMLPPDTNFLLGLGKVLLIASVFCLNGYAEISISDDWGSGIRPDGTRIPDSLNDGTKLEKAAAKSTVMRNAVPLGARGDDGVRELEYKLTIDSKKYYLAPYLFMPKSRPDEICTPIRFSNTPIYKCEEGQHYTLGSHVFIFNETFQEVGYHSIRIAERFPLFCNSVAAVGTGSKKQNEILVTVQYFPVDRKAASKISDIGSGWQRMTVLLRVKAEKGKVLIEQDDTCLGNPNRLETIGDARKKLKQCRTGTGGKP